jgi:hypothetical protein
VAGLIQLIRADTRPYELSRVGKGLGRELACPPQFLNGKLVVDYRRALVNPKNWAARGGPLWPRDFCRNRSGRSDRVLSVDKWVLEVFNYLPHNIQIDPAFLVKLKFGEVRIVSKSTSYSRGLK